MQKIKKIMATIMMIAMLFTMTGGVETKQVNANDTSFAITAPATNSLKAAGYIDITWSNASNIGEVKNYQLFIDGSLVTTTTNTTYEWYSVKVNIHKVWVKANFTNGKSDTTETVAFKVQKKGVCADSNMGKYLKPNALNAAWYYDWGVNELPYTGYDSIEFVPMIWSSRFDNMIQYANSKPSKYTLTYNEPDLPDQANMTVDNVISRWPKFMAISDRISSPATSTWPSSSSGWFQPFMKKINADASLDIDYIAIHCYPDNYPGGSGMATWFMTDVIESAWNLYHKPIWVTEYSTKGTGITQAQTMGFVRAVLPLLDANPHVERYSYFSFNGNPSEGYSGTALWNHNTGELTVSGQMYSECGNATTYVKTGNYTNPKDSVISNTQPTTKAKVKKPSKAKISKLKNLKGRKVKISLKKISRAKGYQIRYSDSKSLNGYWSKTTTKTTYTVKKLSKKKRYYFKVRAYVKDGSKKIYGSWSSKKSIKIKK